MEERQSDIAKPNWCVIVPTYNNHKTLARVLDSVLLQTAQVIVVNDGSTDRTAQILSQYPQITQIHFRKNCGKGKALREGFKKAMQIGYDYAVTIDSDGQHFASDIPGFIESIQNDGDALIIGSRNMKQQGVPGKSSFGNNFSNFWFWFETGIRLTDTQSGFRLYPLNLIPKKYVTNKFEFEIEVIVRSAWKSIPVHNIPIQVLYDPDERVSHFRPFTDFTRISILNTVLVTIALLYIKPRDLLRKIKKKGIKKFLLENILESDDSNAKKAMSIALGVFIGICPFWGFQTVLVLFLAVLLKLNKAIAFAFSNVSIPPMIPFIVYGSLQIGGILTGTKASSLPDDSFSLAYIQNNLTQYLIGSFILASLSALIFGLAGYLLLTFFSTFRDKK
jgi:glycosyltransferase involved in cell wall biosynthesis